MESGFNYRGFVFCFSDVSKFKFLIFCSKSELSVLESDWVWEEPHHRLKSYLPCRKPQGEFKEICLQSISLLGKG